MHCCWFDAVRERGGEGWGGEEEGRGYQNNKNYNTKDRSSNTLVYVWWVQSAQQEEPQQQNKDRSTNVLL